LARFQRFEPRGGGRHIPVNPRNNKNNINPPLPPPQYSPPPHTPLSVRLVFVFDGTGVDGITCITLITWRRRRSVEVVVLRELGCSRLYDHEIENETSVDGVHNLHTSAYVVSLRQHTSACVSIRRETSVDGVHNLHTSAYVVSLRQHASAYSERRALTECTICIRQAYDSIRQHTAACVSIRRARRALYYAVL
jgi:hypothetical protein